VSQPIPIPPRFLERMSLLLGEEFPAFAESLQQSPVHGLRVNTLKLSAEQFKKACPFPLDAGVPWCPSAFTFPQVGEIRHEPGKHPYHLAGLYYLQDPSAMSAAELLAPQPGERVLDLAASPGGKTTHLASLMQGRGLLVANEIKTSRIHHLEANVQRWGADNVVVTNETPERLADHFGACFNRVLVDAPCSGEGMFRKDMGARLDWSEEMLTGCAIRQTNILRVAAHLVRPGGRLLYSTCTFAPEEDEGVAAQFLKEQPEFEVESLPQLSGFSPGHPEWSKASDQSLNLTGAVRLFPHRLAGEGHFAILFKRKDGPAHDGPDPFLPGRIPAEEWRLWLAFKDQVLDQEFPEERLWQAGQRLYLLPESLPVMKGLRTSIPGVWLGTFKKERFEPAHPLALCLHPGHAKKSLDLRSDSREMAAYLRGESLPSTGMPGWTLITADGWPLGWGKRVQGVVKNHFPRGWQIWS